MNLIFWVPGGGEGHPGEALSAPHFRRSRPATFCAGVKNGTPLGQAKPLMDAGKLVPDELVIGIVQDGSGAGLRAGFILDGFPRTIPQADALEVRSPAWAGLDAVVSLEVPRR